MVVEVGGTSLANLFGSLFVDVVCRVGDPSIAGFFHTAARFV